MATPPEIAPAILCWSQTIKENPIVQSPCDFGIRGSAKFPCPCLIGQSAASAEKLRIRSTPGVDGQGPVQTSCGSLFEAESICFFRGHCPRHSIHLRSVLPNVGKLFARRARGADVLSFESQVTGMYDRTRGRGPQKPPPDARFFHRPVLNVVLCPWLVRG